MTRRPSSILFFLLGLAGLCGALLALPAAAVGAATMVETLPCDEEEEDCKDDIVWPDVDGIIPASCDEPNPATGLPPSTQVDVGALVPECKEFSMRWCKGIWNDGEFVDKERCEVLGTDIPIDPDGNVLSLPDVPVHWTRPIPADIDCEIDPQTGELVCTVGQSDVDIWEGDGQCCTSNGLVHCELVHSEGGTERPWAHLEMYNSGECLVVQVSDPNATIDRMPVDLYYFCCEDCEEPPPPACDCSPACVPQGNCCPALECPLPPPGCSCQPSCGALGMPSCCPAWSCPAPPPQPPCVCHPDYGNLCPPYYGVVPACEVIR